MRANWPTGDRDVFSKGMAKLHKIENNADTERRESQRDPQNRDGFAFLENIATAWKSPRFVAPQPEYDPLQG